MIIGPRVATLQNQMDKTMGNDTRNWGLIEVHNGSIHHILNPKPKTLKL